MDRIPEPDLMDDPAQAEAYHRADFTEAHERFVTLFRQFFEAGSWAGPVLDLGCGTADVTRRFARAFDDQRIHGVDGAEAMLRLGREMLEREGLNCRVELFCRYLPVDRLPEPHYGAVISNSLLHHLQDPLTLWSVIRRFATPGAPILVMDLLRPATSERAAELVALYPAGEAEILRRDFFNSLCAAYQPHEVEQQIREAGIEGIDVTTVSDRHWIAWGRV